MGRILLLGLKNVGAQGNQQSFGVLAAGSALAKMCDHIREAAWGFFTLQNGFTVLIQDFEACFASRVWSAGSEQLFEQF
jgi:hypothetical protein